MESDFVLFKVCGFLIWRYAGRIPVRLPDGIRLGSFGRKNLGAEEPQSCYLVTWKTRNGTGSADFILFRVRGF